MSYIRGDNPKEQEYFTYLEEIRQSGVTNMWGADNYLVEEFSLSKKESTEILLRWIKLHDEPGRIIESTEI
jgi:hypothetical protein